MRLLVATVACAFVACAPPVEGEGEGTEGEGEGEGEEEPCVIGDPTADAELEVIVRHVDGTLHPFVDGGEVQLIQPVQGGKVFYIGVQGRNITCHVQITAGVFDSCQDPPIIAALDGRTVILEDDGTGLAVPVNNPANEVVTNLANVPACPSSATSHDINDNTFDFQLRVTEGPRAGETERRVHNLTGSLVPACAQPDPPELLADCLCECDADFNQTKTKPEQCPTIQDNDPATQCTDL